MSRRICRRTRQRGDVSPFLNPIRTLEEIAEEFARRGQPITYQGVGQALKKAEAKIRKALAKDADVMEVVRCLECGRPEA
jgi:hypothetical protein